MSAANWGIFLGGGAKYFFGAEASTKRASAWARAQGMRPPRGGWGAGLRSGSSR